MPLKVKSTTLPATAALLGRSAYDRLTSLAVTVAPAGILKLPKSSFIPPVNVIGVCSEIGTATPMGSVTEGEFVEVDDLLLSLGFVGDVGDVVDVFEVVDPRMAS